MARNRETKIELTAYDDLFQTDESREEAKLSKIRDIPISEIDEFPDHPFKVLMDGDMEQLVESIKRNGVMTPAMAFTPLGLIPDPNGNLTNLRQTLIRSSMLYGRIKGFCIAILQSDISGRRFWWMVWANFS